MKLPSKPLSPAKRLPPKSKNAPKGEESTSGQTPGPVIKEGQSTMTSSANSSYAVIKQPQVKVTLSPGKNSAKGAQIDQPKLEGKEVDSSTQQP